MIQIACAVFLAILAACIWRESKVHDDLFGPIFRGFMLAMMVSLALFIVLVAVVGVFGGFSV